MSETNQIRAVEMVRQIRDDLVRELAGKSPAEIIAFFNRAGDAARADALLRSASGPPSNHRMEPTRDGS